MNKETIPTRLFLKIAYCYLTLPLILFVLGWIRFIYAAPITVCILIILLRMMKKTNEYSIKKLTYVEKKKLLIIFCIIIFWVLLSGIGRQAYQTDDHLWRNAIFETLVNEDWPIIKQISIQGVESLRGISYYIGFWLPSAFIGKIFGVSIGYLFQILWATMGIFIFYYGISIILKKITIFPLLIFIFFSGMDILGLYITGAEFNTIGTGTHIEWWTKFQFSSNTTQLFWVFNQAIPAWLIFVLLYLQKDNVSIVFILANALINCTLPFIGMIPFFLYWVFAREYEVKKWSVLWWKKWFKDTISVENIIGCIIVLISAAFLIKSKAISTPPSLFSLRNGGWLVIFMFLLIEIGGICATIYKHQKFNTLFYIGVIWLCICPLIRVYGEDNFCMRASIPALILLYIYLVQSIDIYWKSNTKCYLYIAIGIFSIGAVTPMLEMIRNISETMNRNVQNQTVHTDSVSIDQVLSNDYESTDVQSSIFYKYLAK